MFIASNGTTIYKLVRGIGLKPDGEVLPSKYGINESEVQALREYFQYERDAELGRWRSKKDPNWTAMLDENTKYVEFRHDDGSLEFSVHCDNRNAISWTTALQDIANEYFTAHPEHKPLPTEPGLYANCSGALAYAHVLRLTMGGWLDDEREGEFSPEELAQRWHDAGQLVRLVPVESEDGE